MRVGRGITLSTAAIGTALARLNCSPSSAIFIDLRLSGIQQYKQAGIVVIAGVVDDSILEILRSDGRAVREVGCIGGI